VSPSLDYVAVEYRSKYNFRQEKSSSSSLPVVVRDCRGFIAWQRNDVIASCVRDVIDQPLLRQPAAAATSEPQDDTLAGSFIQLIACEMSPPAVWTLLRRQVLSFCTHDDP